MTNQNSIKCNLSTTYAQPKTGSNLITSKIKEFLEKFDLDRAKDVNQKLTARAGTSLYEIVDMREQIS